MGFWSTLGKIGGAVGAAAAAPFTGGASLTSLPSILGMAGAGLGAISQGQAQNRGEQFVGQLALQQLLMQRDNQGFQNAIQRAQFGETSATDAIKKLLGAQRVLNPMQRPNLTPYAAPQRQYTDAERTGAQALTDEVMKRLQGGNPIQPFQQSPMQIDPKLLQPGTLEKIFGYASPILGGLSAISAAQKPPLVMSSQQPTIQRIGTTAIPGNIASPGLPDYPYLPTGDNATLQRLMMGLRNG